MVFAQFVASPRQYVSARRDPVSKERCSSNSLCRSAPSARWKASEKSLKLVAMRCWSEATCMAATPISVSSSSMIMATYSAAPR